MNSPPQIAAPAPRGLAHAFKNSSIRTKLTLLIVGTTSMALVLAGAGLLGYESREYRGAATREVSALAEILAAGSTAALSFGDKQAARETLAALHGDRRLLRAVVYDKAGESFAAYEQPGTGAAPTPAVPGRTAPILSTARCCCFNP